VRGRRHSCPESFCGELLDVFFALDAPRLHLTQGAPWSPCKLHIDVSLGLWGDWLFSAVVFSTLSLTGGTL